MIRTHAKQNLTWTLIVEFNVYLHPKWSGSMVKHRQWTNERRKLFRDHIVQLIIDFCVAVSSVFQCSILSALGCFVMSMDWFFFLCLWNIFRIFQFNCHRHNGFDHVVHCVRRESGAKKTLFVCSKFQCPDVRDMDIKSTTAHSHMKKECFSCSHAWEQ